MDTTKEGLRLVRAMVRMRIEECKMRNIPREVKEEVIPRLTQVDTILNEVDSFNFRSFQVYPETKPLTIAP